jgi:archaemetzincin
MILILLGALAAVAAAERENALYRPPPDVANDPPAFYAPDLFEPMPKPGPGDWMAAHPEPPQSFGAYVASDPIRPTRRRHVLVVSQVGPMDSGDAARLGVLREFLGLFYTLPCRDGPAVGLENVTSRQRSILGRRVTQYLTGDILHKVLAPALPPDAVCFQGVTMDDLYPDPSWNYVFGQASLRRRVGIYSLVRFQPAFWGEPQSDVNRRLALVRSLKTLVHETGHMFGVHHCQRFECVMNGSNHLAESDARPVHLCPECLKKFRWALGFDMIKRYEALRAFYKKHGLTDEAAWVAKRLRQCRGAASDTSQ